MPASEPSESKVAATPPRRDPGPIFFVALVVAVLLTGTLAGLAVYNRTHQTQASTFRVSGIPASVSTPLANLMALSPVPPRIAPGFTLTDQNGHTISMKSLRGGAVVLEFMDPHCVDICPLVSQEFIDAYHDLGQSARRVSFIAVNVNRSFLAVANMAAFTREHKLNTIPTWHFFTGSFGELRAVWRNYGITVETSSTNGDVIHTSEMFFIDPQGHERYIATPQVDHTSKGMAFLPSTSLTSWGQGVALVAKSLVP